MNPFGFSALTRMRPAQTDTGQVEKAVQVRLFGGKIASSQSKQCELWTCKLVQIMGFRWGVGKDGRKSPLVVYGSSNLKIEPTFCF